jgi:hypothetical protein
MKGAAGKAEETGTSTRAALSQRETPYHASMLAKLSYPGGRNRKVSRIYGNALLVTAPKRLRR